MTLNAISHGPNWIVWGVFAIVAAISIILLSGRGANLIAGYNTSKPAEKAKYDEKKLCRVAGSGMLVISLLILAMGLLENVLPASFASISAGIVFADIAIMLFLMNTVCKK